MRRTAAVISVAVLLVTGAASSALAAGSDSTAGWWQMNEPTESAVALDNSGHQLHGVVGSDVQTGVSFGKRTGYRFPYISSSSGPRPSHIVQVPESPLLDPQTADFSVTLRFRSNQSWANLVQKGQSGMTGGFWKVDISSGILTCLFRDENGNTSTAASGTQLNDGAWHTVRCDRTTESVVMYVDGEWRDTRTNPTGYIDNTSPLTIAGKAFCGDGIQCDYWWGDMDFVKVIKADSVPPSG